MTWISAWYKGLGGGGSGASAAEIAAAVEAALADNFNQVLGAIAGTPEYSYDTWQVRAIINTTALDGDKWLTPIHIYDTPLIAIDYQAGQGVPESWDYLGRVFRLEYQADLEGGKWAIVDERDLRPKQWQLINWGRAGNWKLGIRFIRGIRPGLFKVYEAISEG